MDRCDAAWLKALASSTNIWSYEDSVKMVDLPPGELAHVERGDGDDGDSLSIWGY